MSSCDRQPGHAANPSYEARLPMRRAQVYSAAVRKWVWASLVLACGILLRVPSFLRASLSDDESIYAATAAAMARGDFLYRDVVDHKPPLIYYLYRLGFALFGAFNTHGAHLLLLLAVLVTAGLIGKLAQRERGKSSVDLACGAAAAGLFLVFSTTWHDYDALAANCELFLLLPQTAAGLLLLRSLGADQQPIDRQPRFARHHLTIGLLIGLAGLCKYQGLTFLGVSAAMLGWAVVVRRVGLGRAAAALAIQTAAALLPAVAYLGICSLRGNAKDAVFWFAFNFSYLSAGLDGMLAVRRAIWRVGLIGGVAVVPYGLGLWSAVRTTRSVVATIGHPDRGASLARLEPRDLLALAWLASSALAVAAGGRFFGHYFHLVLPALCVLAAPRFVELWRRCVAARVLLTVLCAVPALTFFLLATVARPWAEKMDGREPPYAVVGARMAALTRPEDRVFVWGNSPQLYLLSRRPLGTRFTFCNYMTGESPGTPTETGDRDADRSSLPDSWDMLFADLAARQPELFVDVAAAGWDGYDKFPVARYPRLAAYVAVHYALVETVSGVAIYRRKIMEQARNPALAPSAPVARQAESRREGLGRGPAGLARDRAGLAPGRAGVVRDPQEALAVAPDVAQNPGGPVPRGGGPAGSRGGDVGVPGRLGRLSRRACAHSGRVCR